MEGAIVYFAVLMSVFGINAGYIEAFTLNHPFNTGWEYKGYLNKRRLRMKTKNGFRLTFPFPTRPSTMPPTMPPTMPSTMPPTIPPKMLRARSLVEISPNLFAPFYLVQSTSIISFSNVRQSVQRIWFSIKKILTKPIRARHRTRVKTTTLAPQKLFFDNTPEFPDVLESTGKPVILPILMRPVYRVTNNRISITNMNEIVVTEVGGYLEALKE